MLKLFPLVLLAFPLAASAELINGAGATFPYPLYSKWFSEYRKVDSSVEINYQSIGSGGGIKQFLEKTVDFGASDAPMKDDDVAKAADGVVHVPTVLGAVVLTYNLSGVSELNLNAEVVTELFLGKITQWNDPKLKALNPKANLPAQPIVLVRRSDGSGTSYIFTDYLAKVSPEWKEKVGAGTAVNWPAGLGAKGNEGVTGMIKQTPGSIGYVEFIYAANNKLAVASLKNKSGKQVKPSVASVSAAAAGALKTMPEDFRVSITDADGKDAYPISGFTYLLVPAKLEKEKGGKIVKFLKWALKEGQKLAPELHYAPLPAGLAGKVEKKIQSIALP